HWENMGWGWQIVFVISVILVCAWLLIIVDNSWLGSPKIAIAAGLVVVLLPLSGANGLLFTPFAASWLAAGTLLRRREIIKGWIPAFHSICVMVGTALTGLYFVGYELPPWAPPNPGLGPTLLTGARFIGMALGPVGAGRFPPKWITGGLVCAVVAI